MQARPTWSNAFERGERQRFLRLANGVLGQGAIKFSGQSALVAISHVKEEFKDLLKPRNHQTVKGLKRILGILDEGNVPLPTEDVAPEQGAPVGPTGPPEPEPAQPVAEPELPATQEGTQPAAEPELPAAHENIEPGTVQESEFDRSTHQPTGVAHLHVPRSAKERYLALIDTLAKIMEKHEENVKALRVQIDALEAELGDDVVNTDEEVALGHRFLQELTQLRKRKAQHSQLLEAVGQLSGKMVERTKAYGGKCAVLRTVLKKANAVCKGPTNVEDTEGGASPLRQGEQEIPSKKRMKESRVTNQD
eukprot:TRINITY_DN17782_c0_g1_i2.p1 TRINITY_DN17782_c0_g1~~TRINITY_DN17782_c0_g1_i2.p1  ORF type:complete len:307 (+),score=39.47 TRINITY_DN17782_c0_g1_i2:109-1029(+)